MATNKKEEYLLSSVKNALRLLKCFSMDEPEKKISDLAATLGLHKSTVSRTLATLASEGFVSQDPDTKKYRLGLSVLTLSGVVNSTMEIYRESLPILKKLVDDIGETAHISMLDGFNVIYLQKVDCNHPIRYLTHVGKTNPSYCTSSGKVLLAHSSDDFVDKVIESGLKASTKATITDPDQLRAHLRKVKEQGFSYSLGELLEGVNSVAAPIFDYTGNVIAALTVVGPSQRIDQHQIRPLAKKIINASMEISDNMGYWK
ncbi:IclR family transcriptional regulator [Bacillus sp. Marseille-P3661]|uniref:IclR family transcriptional regulator n=1 Tax=Bacillus sp. Marseille-P3661 TaxID=1936234 RepID=UPI000C8219FB|nr:IclR family transcriptional regulator [Bacillus sp. Marseille-P3661]